MRKSVGRQPGRGVTEGVCGKTARERYGCEGVCGKTARERCGCEGVCGKTGEVRPCEGVCGKMGGATL